MQPISLSFFVDFMLTAGTGRLAAVRQLKTGAATTSILASVLGPTWPGTTFALLDVRRAKFYPHRTNEGMSTLLRAEAACLAKLSAEI